MPRTSAPVAALDAVDQRGSLLRVEFLRQADRLGHQVCLVGEPGCCEVLLSSREGPSCVDAECVPALQSLNIERLRDGRAAAALVGMSGGTHWSLTVEVQQFDGSARLMFDAACRIKLTPPRVESRYRIGTDARIVAAPTALHVAGTTGEVRVETFQNRDVPAAEATSVCDQLQVRCEIGGPDLGQRTLRWQYAFTLVGS